MSEWKPGDVAATEYNGVQSRALVVRGDWLCPTGHDRGPHWHSAGGGWNPLDDDAVTFRRLAVIDPEDRAQVERLAAAYVAAADRSTPPYGVGNVDMAAVADSTQAALREYAAPKPPKPDEPTGLGAVVEDADGVRWVRRSTHPARSWSADTGSFQKSDDWSNITAARVLSPGVEVDQ